jgi:hypothetical protein
VSCQLATRRARHQRERIAFGLESTEHHFGIHPRLDDLEGYLSAERLFLLSHVNQAHAALANQLSQLVGANPLAFEDSLTQGDGRLALAVFILAEETARLLVRSGEPLKTLSQLGIFAADAVEVLLSLIPAWAWIAAPGLA